MQHQQNHKSTQHIRHHHYLLEHSCSWSLNLILMTTQPEIAREARHCDKNTTPQQNIKRQGNHWKEFTRILGGGSGGNSMGVAMMPCCNNIGSGYRKAGKQTPVHGSLILLGGGGKERRRGQTETWRQNPNDMFRPLSWMMGHAVIPKWTQTTYHQTKDNNNDNVQLKNEHSQGRSGDAITICLEWMNEWTNDMEAIVTVIIQGTGTGIATSVSS